MLHPSKENSGTKPGTVHSIRDASDPEVPQMATIKDEKAWAGKIYEQYGYYTAANSVLACWATITQTT